MIIHVVYPTIVCSLQSSEYAQWKMQNSTDNLACVVQQVPVFEGANIFQRKIMYTVRYMFFSKNIIRRGRFKGLQRLPRHIYTCNLIYFSNRMPSDFVHFSCSARLRNLFCWLSNISRIIGNVHCNHLWPVRDASPRGSCCTRKGFLRNTNSRVVIFSIPTVYYPTVLGSSFPREKNSTHLERSYSVQFDSTLGIEK